ncbi:MAG: HAMP domain-containing sensor histidine kinase [Saprospiraceae bacterium]|nr:HAMP domain-containing histidine kinase [Saprospiraceae bacterium]MDG1432480.1 HAMP domain-containing sensor histidine kinase [Saprospiraceae bacterium]MDG2417370.1 HAMP domain-containing sensor histidine kinase [Saprospiraceae bacterium]
MSNKTIIGVVILGALAIIGIISIQSYWVLKTWDIKSKEFNQSVRIALRKTTEKLAEADQFEIPSKELVTQISSNYYVVNTEASIDAGNLEHFLRQELEVISLNEDFEYGIYDCSSQEMVYGNYCAFDNLNTEPSKKTERLPEVDKFTYYFGVTFPNRESHLMGEMQLSILFSVLSLITILFFIYALTVILKQRRLSQMQKDFINNMTHEFKTPISTIKISSNVFLKNEEIQKNERLLRYANIINIQNDRLNNQVEKVLQIARLEGDSFELKKEKINVNTLLENIVKSEEIKIPQIGGNISMNLQTDNSSIEADKLHLTNIIHNLLDNAIKYCKTTPEISIKTREIENKLELRIIDKGIGIKKEFLPQIFQKFYRVPTGDVHNIKGFGLGLFYVKNICKAHGWKIEAKSKEGEGTEFRIIIRKSGF